MKYKNSLDLFINKKSGDLIIQTMGLDEKLKLPTPDGPMISFSRSDACGKIWIIIRELLVREPGVVLRGKKEGLNAMDRKSERAFEKKHHSIGVNLTDGNLIELIAMRPYRKGGSIGEHGQCVTIRLNASEKTFWDALAKVVIQLEFEN